MAAAKKSRSKISKKPASPRKAAPSKKTPPKFSFDFLKSRKFLITAGIVVAVLIVSFFPIALATDQSVFCKSCHTMQPFYVSYMAGPHADHATCIDCHVDAGYPARFSHKFVALKEVYAQFFGNAKFPNYNADVPDSRCLRCHPDAPTKVVGQFQHGNHIGRGIACAKCHATTGHKVTFEALGAAGLLNSANAPAGAQFVGQQFTSMTGKGSAYPGHKPVPCQNCHDQANLDCSFCHTPPANHFAGNCRQCHVDASVPFKQFQHPPTHHYYLSRPCVKCHPVDFAHVYCTCHKGNPPQD